MKNKHPVLASIKDQIYPFSGITLKRDTVRGVIINEKHEVAVLQIECNDLFGPRHHFELPGGGVEPGESIEQTLHREILEEVGATIDRSVFLGVIELDYNLLKRTDVAHFFMANLVSEGENYMTDEEKNFIKAVKWIPIDTLIMNLETIPQEGVGKLIHSRDLIALKIAQSFLEDRLTRGY